MNETTRRGLLAGALAAGVGGLSLHSVSDLLETVAPLSGRAWDAADRELSERIESPHGPATVQYDEYGVPTIAAETDDAASFAVGYVQAFDRLFQLDIQRRVMRGQVSELAGEATLSDDRFYTMMDFVGAAEATWDLVRETPAGPLVEAYAAGVNAAIDGEQLPLEFELLGYEPREWTPVDTLLMETQISWDLTGNFSDLRREVIAQRLGEDTLEELYPEYLAHDVPILHDEIEGDRLEETEFSRLGETADVRSLEGGGKRATSERGDRHELASWLSGFESPPGVGSNSWVVGGDHTESGAPIVAYDPHLSLMTPPLWYEQHVETPHASVRGATFPGVPFVIAGANETGVWSFTNVGADVLDCYEYDLRESASEASEENGANNANDDRESATDADEYYYDGEWREFDTETREIVVSGGDNRRVQIKKTVHGPFLEREGQTVGVAWTGHTATRTTEAIYEFERSDGLEDVLEATRKFDLPTQNLVYADADGRTLYYATGKLPIRRIDGEPVSGNQVFDGSAGEGEWDGFTPFGESSWEGFVPFEAKPHAIDADVLATANQRVVDDPDHYIGVDYATPYRGARIEERLHDRLESGEPTDFDFHRDLQNDIVDGRVEQFVPELLEAVAENESVDDRVADAAASLEAWDARMARESSSALVFARWLAHYREAVFEPTFAEADLDESYYPNDWVLAGLESDSRWFDERTRAETMVSALRDALEGIDAEGWDTYGDWNSTRTLEHPFSVEAPFLDYEDHPADGSVATVKNYRVESGVGASWRMIVEPGGDATAILPGGNSGDYFSPHYDDQLQPWLDGDQKSMTRTGRTDGEADAMFVSTDSADEDDI